VELRRRPAYSILKRLLILSIQEFNSEEQYPE